MTLKAGSWRKMLKEVQAEDENPLHATHTATTKSKSKSHTEIIPVGVHRWKYDGSKFIDSDWELSFLRSESIAYECTKKQRTGFCHHVKTEQRPLISRGGDPGPVYYHQNGRPLPDNYKEVYTGPFGSPPTFVNGVGNAGFFDRVAQTYATIDDIPRNAIATAVNTMTPRISSDMSSLVTLAELRDLVGLVKDPIKIARSFSKLARKSRTKAFVKLFAEGHLSYKFTYKQAYSDALQLYTVFTTVNKRVEDLVSRSGGVMNTSRAYVIKRELTNVFPTQLIGEHPHNRAVRWGRSTLREVVNVSMRYTYALEDAAGRPLHDKRLIKALATLDALGIQANPAILWDLLPFSFVVDYFVKVGDFLEQLKLENLNARVRIADLCLTHKCEHVREVHFQNLFDANGTSRWARETGRFGAIEYHTVFDRRRISPTPEMLHPDPSLSLSDPSWGQWATMFSLITANLR